MEGRHALGVALVLCAAGCSGGGGGDDVTGNGGPDFSIAIAASPSQVTLPVGMSVTVALSLTRGGGYAGAVSFSAEGIPEYVAATFDPPMVAGTATQSTLSLTAQDIAAGGSYSISVRASGDSVSSAQVTVACNVVLVPDFRIALATDTVPVTLDSTASVAVAINRLANFAGAVTLSLEGAPPGVTATFDPNPAGGAQSTLSIGAGANAVTGTYQATVRGKSSGLADRSASLTLEISSIGGFSLAVSPGSVAIASPGSAQVTVTITRTGGFAGAVSLFAEGYPAGATVSVSPQPVTGSTATLTINAPAGVTENAYDLAVRGEATGQPIRRVTFKLTVQQVPGFSFVPTSPVVTTLAGAQAQLVPFSLRRSGGFAGAVTFTVTGLPVSITATFNPPSTTGTQTVLSISAAAGTAPQNYAGTVIASASGLPSQSAPLTVNVVASGTSIVWRFCGPGAAPVFFAFNDGSSAYTVVAPAGDGSYNISLASGRGVVTFAVPEFTLPPTDGNRPLSPFAARASHSRRSVVLASRSILSPAAAVTVPGTTTYVYYGSTSELQLLAAAQCTSPVVRKTVSGSVAGVPSDQGYGVFLGTVLTYGLAGASPTFTLNGVEDGTRDLVAARLTVGTGPGDEITVTPNRFITRRALNPPNGSALPVLDFGSAEARDAVSAPLTLTGTNGARVELSTIISTANGSASPVSVDPLSTATTRTWYGLPATLLIAGDLQAVFAEAETGGREVISYGREVGARTVAFGPQMNWPDVSVYALTPSVRVRAVVNVGAPLTQYGGMLEATFEQPAIQRAIIMHFAKTTLQATQLYELRTPVLAGLPGWNENLYGLQAGSPLQWTTVSFSEWMLKPAEGAVLRTLRASGQFTP